MVTIGTALVAAAVIMLFAGLIGTYLSVRGDTIASVTAETQSESCLGFLESNPGLAARVNTDGSDGASCIAAMRTAAINEGPCSPATNRPDFDAERPTLFNLEESEIPACQVLEVIDNPELSGSGWLPSGVRIPLTPGGMGMFTLVISLGTAMWAVWAAKNNVKGQLYAALGITVLLGLAYMNQIASLYTQMGLVLSGSEDSRQAVLIYAITGGHLIFVGATLAFMALMGLRAGAGQMTGRDSEAVSAATLLWFVAVGIFAFIWLSILVTK